MNLAECHERLANIPDLGPMSEPLSVLEMVERHRVFWRPSTVRVILLAESHVYTSAEELNYKIQKPYCQPNGFPNGFVRLVYCLGYGENGILSRPISTPRNTGTPQYWKIFYSCLHPITQNSDFGPIQSSRTPETAKRLCNKIQLLKALQALGIWLLDASIAALYRPGKPKPSRRTIRDAIETSWDCCVGRLIQDAKPEAIVCIGKEVKEALKSRLDSLKCARHFLPQPNARLSASEHMENFRRYYEICQNPRSARD
ncbi:MAG: hypothetical protein ABSH28_09840 [Acidobacteriota bacterium]|jgi:hypothetical protein